MSAQPVQQRGSSGGVRLAVDACVDVHRGEGRPLRPPLEHVIYGLRWTRHLAEFADYVWVDLDTAGRRLDTLTTTEQAAIAAALDESEKTA